MTVVSWHRALSSAALFAAALLICGIADVERVHAQDTRTFFPKQETIRDKALKPPTPLTPLISPPEPPKTLPDLHCASDRQRSEVRGAFENWRYSVSHFYRLQEKEKTLIEEIKSLQQSVARNWFQGQQLVEELQKLAHQQDDLANIQSDIADAIQTIYQDEKAYNKALDSVPKACPPPQPQTTPQPPPSNPPPVQPPSGGGGRFAPHLLPPQQWLTGVYGGFGLGVQNTIGGDWITNEIVSLGHPDFVPDDNSGNFTTGFRVSAYAGYDWIVVPRWLAGIEGDVGYSTNRTTAGIPGVSSAPGDSLSMQENWDASLRARLGYLVTPQVLLYGTTGAAWQHFSATVTCTSMTPFPCGRFGPVAPMTATNAATPTGWTIGAGLEYALTGRLKLRAEYRYSDYGTVNATFDSPANLAIGSSIHMQTQTATLGLSYTFGGPWAPPATPLVTK